MKRFIVVTTIIITSNSRARSTKTRIETSFLEATNTTNLNYSRARSTKTRIETLALAGWDVNEIIFASKIH
ncbi:hypothetical protein MSMAP_1233 [Methanosarcina mazei SarPi]|uniref:Uncharacterized protein n=1 Tax=Methanosarcina mazei SarPi TaxID=1434115 RepID=A0A0E3RBE2_METMZ|nr:hypothetical protein MSMAP_1233 [Methanosarcina mazei SarPi]